MVGVISILLLECVILFGVMLKDNYILMLNCIAFILFPEVVNSWEKKTIFHSCGYDLFEKKNSVVVCAEFTKSQIKNPTQHNTPSKPLECQWPCNQEAKWECQNTVLKISPVGQV